MKGIVYIKEVDGSGNPLMLYRFRETDTELWSEYLEGHLWQDDATLMEIPMNLHSPQYKEIEEEEAAKIAEALGGSIYKD